MRIPRRRWLVLTILASCAMLLVVTGRLRADEEKGRTEKLTPEQRARLEKEWEEAADDVARYCRVGRYREALPRQERILAICERLYAGQDHPDLATSLHIMGALVNALGDPRRALSYAERALAMNERLYPRQDHPDLAGSLNGIGALLHVLGRTREALPYLERALAMRERLHRRQDHAEVAQGLNNMGVLYMSLGDPRRALSYAERALAMYERLYPRQDQRDLAASLNNLGDLLRGLGEPRQALPYHERALAMRERLYSQRDHPNLARSLNNMGGLLETLGEPHKARPYLERALAMYERLYPRRDQPDLATSLSNMGGLLLALGEPQKALTYYERALAMNERLHPSEDHIDLARSLNNMGTLVQTLREPQKAQAYYERSLAMRERLYPGQDHPALATSFNNMSGLLLQQGQPDKALPYMERSLAIYRRQVIDLAASAPEAQALAFAASLPGTRDRFLSLTRHIDRSNARAYAPVWDAKAAVTRVLERRHLAARAARDKKTDAMRLELIDTGRQIARLLLQPSRNTEARDKEVNRLTAHKEKLERDLAALLPELRQRQERDRLGPSDLARRLPDGTAFLDFVRYVAFDFAPAKPGKDGEKPTLSYAAFVLVKGRPITRVELGPARPIDDAVTAWRRAIADWRANLSPAERRDLIAQADGHGARLSRLVWDKIAAQLPAGTNMLYLSPDGDLARLPWAALPTGRADKVLLDDYLLAVVPHGPFLLARLMDPVPAPGTDNTLVVYGGIDYEEAPVILAQADTPGRLLRGDKRMEWKRLPGTESERQSVLALAERAFKGRVISRTGRAASTAQLLADLPRGRYAHLATHGLFAAELLTEERRRLHEQLKGWEYQSGRVTEGVGLGVRSPLAYTGLVLAGANDPDRAGPDGGVATGETLVELPLEGLRLCVLSACETGLGELTEGEGVQGLVRAFHLAGCPDVVASLWQINDRVTAALMAKFYHELWINRRPPLEALREAQLLVSRRPDLVALLAGDRGPAKVKEAVKVASTEEPPKEAAVGERLPPKLWAALILSGLGR